MTKHAKKSNHLQAVDLPKTMAVEIPLPLLGAFANIENSFFGLCIDAGQQVLAAMMEKDREDLCGPRWKRDPDRRAGRAGTTKSEVTLGGRRIPVSRPRVRSKEGEEIDLPSFCFATKRDPLDRHALTAVACGISNRKYARSLDPLPEEMEERSTSKSSVSRRYVAMTTKQMTSWLTMPVGDRHFPIVMIDGIHLGDPLVLIALGIDLEGKKQVLGLREGDTENGQVARALLRDLVERGLDQERARLFVIDGAKALTSAIRKMFGPLAAIQRCQIHKERNVLGHLPDHKHQSVKAVLKEAWSQGDAKVAKRRLERLASSLETDHPGAAASVREGLDETLTLQALGVSGTLYKKLRTTNAIENLNSGIVTYSKNVKRWQGGSMVVRWTSAAIVEAERKFRRVHGWRDIEKLVRALDVLEASQQEQGADAQRVA
jgi:transposase-like protein